MTEVPDIDIVWLGSLDARISMNLPGNFGLGGDEPEWIEARDKFFEVLDKHDKPYGGFSFFQPPFGTAEGFKKAMERMSFVMASADVMHLSNLYEDLKVARKLVAEVRATSDEAVSEEASRVEKLTLSSNTKEVPSESV